jgi:hypothetical protein
MSRPKIVYAVEMLHYLPLYMAYDRYLSDGFDLELAPPPHGDKSAIERLMSSLSPDRDVNFCVCDPMMVNLKDAYSATSGDWPVVIGQLIQKVPFWAVNHSLPNFDDEDKFAQFDQVFAYPEPNTGYVFGTLINNRCSKLRGEQPRPLGVKEIDADLDVCLNIARSVVIEADILKIRRQEESTLRRIVFSYPLHPKYKRFCFTALITTRKFLGQPGGMEKARLLVQSLQRATYLIYTEHDIALEYAIRKFSGMGFSREIVDGALRQLTDQNVFSRSLAVDYSGWQKSIYVQKQVNSDFSYPDYRKFIDNSISRREYHSLLRRQAEGSPYLLVRNVGDYFLARKAASLVLSLLLVIYPAFVIGFESHAWIMMNGTARFWLAFHLVLTFVVLAIFYFRGRVTAFFNLDPSSWIAHSFVIAVGYLISDAGVIIEFMRSLGPG